MDNNSKKLKIIDFITNLENENLLNVIEETINKNSPFYKTITKDELIKRAESSNHDIENNRYLELNEFQEEIKKW